MAAELKVVERSVKQIARTRIYKVKEPHAPAGYKLRYNHGNCQPRRGEIKRLVQAFLAKFYRDLPQEIRHEGINLYKIQVVVNHRLGTWLGGLLGSDGGYYYVPPCRIAEIMRDTEVDGCFFDISKDTVRLMTAEEGLPTATIDLQLDELGV